MKILIRFIVFIAFIINISFAKVNEIDKLSQEIMQTNDKVEKVKLIEQLKKKLANKNKIEQQKADAIIKAKQKLPQKTYSESLKENE